MDEDSPSFPVLFVRDREIRLTRQWNMAYRQDRARGCPRNKSRKLLMDAVLRDALIGIGIAIALITGGCNVDTMNYLWPTYEYDHQGMSREQYTKHLHEQMRKDGDPNWDVPFMDE